MGKVFAGSYCYALEEAVPKGENAENRREVNLGVFQI
jgi:hypothetical protein